MRARAEYDNKIIDKLDERVRQLEKELEQLRFIRSPDKIWRPFSQISDLREGDIVRMRGRDEQFHVMQVYGNYASLMKTHELTNPSAWEVLR